MELVEFYRARSVVLWTSGVFLALVALVMVSSYRVMVSSAAHDTNPNVPLEALALLAGLVILIVSTILGTALSRENSVIELSWTKPIDHAVLAARYIAVDVAALFAIYCIVLIVEFACIQITPLRGHVSTDADSPATIMLTLGGPLMWYGLVLLATCTLRARGGMVAGLLWPAAILLIILASAPIVPEILRDPAIALNYLNPLVYVSVANSDDQRPHGLLKDMPMATRALLTWSLAAVYCTAAALLWKNREA